MAAAAAPRAVFDFEASARTWDTLYDAPNFDSVAYYRPRLERTLAWVDSLALPVDARVLEIGFGAGRTAIALAQRGLLVTGARYQPEHARAYGAASGALRAEPRIRLGLGDAHALDAEDGTFDLVIALGVLPWVERPGWCLREMARVTRPGGHVIASVNNRRQLNRVLDPRLNPLVEPAKRALPAHPSRPSGETPRIRATTRGVSTRAGSRRRVCRRCGRRAWGSGASRWAPGRCFRETTSIRMNERLQARADAGFPGLRSAGGQLLVLSRKRR